MGYTANWPGYGLDRELMVSVCLLRIFTGTLERAREHIATSAIVLGYPRLPNSVSPAISVIIIASSVVEAEREGT